MYLKRTENRICQGDILENFEYRFPTFRADEVEIASILLPYAVVVTQDCDLEWDFKNRADSQKNSDKYLQSILICPAYVAEKFRTGKHLEGLKLTMESWSSDRWKLIKQNQNERFHFFVSNVENGIPELVIDFKNFYTVPRDSIYDVYKSKYKISIAELFREDLSQRFANYLSRIGLPVSVTEKVE